MIPNTADELLASPHYGERWARHWMNNSVYRFSRVKEIPPSSLLDTVTILSEHSIRSLLYAAGNRTYCW